MRRWCGVVDGMNMEGQCGVGVSASYRGMVTLHLVYMTTREERIISSVSLPVNSPLVPLFFNPSSSSICVVFVDVTIVVPIVSAVYARK